MQSKLTAKDDEVKLLEEKLVKLQGALEQGRLKHDAEMQPQSAAQLTQIKKLEAIEQERDLFRATAELRHKAESLQKEVDESRQSKKKDADELSQSLQAVTRERDFHQDKAESSQKELNELKRSLAQLLQARQS
jgi:hypothetical protein